VLGYPILIDRLCAGKYCDVLSAPDNGNVMCSQAPPNIWGSTCTFSCKYGYRLEGNSSLNCIQTEDLKGWDVSKLPECVGAYCYSLSPLLQRPRKMLKALVLECFKTVSESFVVKTPLRKEYRLNKKELSISMHRLMGHRVEGSESSGYC
jgi:hypothetical protein